ncbi:MAG: hypothetical protein JSR40_15890 [Proteobacteria bacterium]|nr:hypothetical protein [Pseudomonadota bacterium]
MLTRKSFQLIVASVLARAPNFLLPILAIRILDFPSYSIFAAGFAAAGSMSAFIGEAIAATISRESFRVNQGRAGSLSLSKFFCASVVCAYIFIVALIGLYLLLSIRKIANDERAWLTAAATILLLPAYLIPAAATALANAHHRGNVSTLATLIGVPLSIASSLLIGVNFGVVYFLLAYFIFVVLTNYIVWIKAAPTPRSEYAPSLTEIYRSYGPALLAILLPFLLGGPVHGLCLFVLARAADGPTELAKFVAYYPWSISVSVLAAMLANYVIQTLVELKRTDDYRALRRFIVKLLIFANVIAISISGLLWINIDLVFVLYGPNFERDPVLFGWILVCGIGLTIISTTGQVLIGIGSKKGLIFCAMINALVYVGLCTLLVGNLNLGATGLARSLSYSLFVFVLTHLIFIFRYLYFLPRLSAASRKTPC